MATRCKFYPYGPNGPGYYTSSNKWCGKTLPKTARRVVRRAGGARRPSLKSGSPCRGNRVMGPDGHCRAPSLPGRQSQQGGARGPRRGIRINGRYHPSPLDNTSNPYVIDNTIDDTIVDEGAVDDGAIDAEDDEYE